MSKLKEITGYGRGKKEIMNYKIPEGITVPPMKDVLMLALTDDEGRYLYKLVKIEPIEDKLPDIAGESISINLNDIKEIFIILTDEQRDLVMHVYHLYKTLSYDNESDEHQEKPKIILQGPAGTGKSTIIGLIEKLITWEENKTSDSPQNIKVIKCAFTGKAASNIEGSTLNHIFSIPIYKTRNLSKKRLETKKEVLKDCILFICDEISMVGQKTMTAVNSRLQQIFESNKLYGDRFVLLVGDLYQIDPVMQKPVYPNSRFWTCCDFYELTKIMRQQDENFIRALNNFRDSKMTQKDIMLLKSREIQDYDEVPDSAIHIFYLNIDVDEYNTLKLNKSNEKEEVVNTVEDSDKWEPSQLRVKIGIRYMLTYNIDVGDGLANGTTGIVKDFDYDKHGCVSAVWMEFHSDAIGRKAKAEYLKKHGDNKPGCENWVPIQRLKMVVKLKTNPNVTKTVGKMFHLKAAEAITVHKSQGQTYHEGVCVHITEDTRDRLRTDKSLQYVALTRVTSVDNLYIMGNLDFSVPNSKKFIRTEEEINRLRSEKKLKLAFETFEDKSGDVIIYLNTGATFNEHYEFITRDRWYGNASLLIFSETNTVSSDRIKVPNFEMAFRTDNGTTVGSRGGMICYKKNCKSLKVISSLKGQNNKMYLTLILFENVYIVAGVKGNATDVDFARAIIKFISNYVKSEKCIFFIGDINQNITPTLEDVFDCYNVKRVLSCDISDTSENDDNKCDVILTRNLNIDRDQVGFYQYIPSAHNPVYVILPTETVLLSNSESQSVDDESQSVGGASQSVDGKSKSIDDDSESMENESHSEHSESQSVNSESQSVDRESPFIDDDSRSMEKKYTFTNRKSDSKGGYFQSIDGGSQSMDDDSQSTENESQFTDGEPQSEESDSQSLDGNTPPLSQPMDMD